MRESKGRDVYLDFAATTPCDERVVEAMLPYFSSVFGNPSSRTHMYGARAARAVEQARSQAAELLGSRTSEIIWTSGATESNNLAILGVLSGGGGARQVPHMITSAIEHSSILRCCRHMEERGVEVTYLKPSPAGVIPPGAVAEAFRSSTRLVSLFWANNEIGTINDVPAIGALCRDAGVLLHVDGSQMVGKEKVDVRSSYLDLLSWSSHKLYGPKGVGALYVCRSSKAVLHPILWGGSQEQGLRPGTLNVPGIVGFGAACALCLESMAADGKAAAALRDLVEANLQRAIPTVVINGSAGRRLRHLSSLSFPGVKRPLIDNVVGIACSSGSACASGVSEPSHVLLALGWDRQIAANSLRLSFGRPSTRSDADNAVTAIVSAVQRGGGGPLVVPVWHSRGCGEGRV